MLLSWPEFQFPNGRAVSRDRRVCHSQSAARPGIRLAGRKRTPTGFRPPAQGCPSPRGLPWVTEIKNHQPQRGCGLRFGVRWHGARQRPATPLWAIRTFPLPAKAASPLRSATALQRGRNPVGVVNRCYRFPWVALANSGNPGLEDTTPLALPLCPTPLNGYGQTGNKQGIIAQYINHNFIA